MGIEYEPGELFVYTNGNRWELGMVKRPNGRGDGYFCWYSRGDTASNTPVAHMHKLENAGFTHIEQLLDAATVGAGTCHGEIDSDYFECKLTTFKCQSCGWSGIVDNGYAGYSFGGTDIPRHCPNCGAKVVSE